MDHAVKVLSNVCDSLVLYTYATSLQDMKENQKSVTNTHSVTYTHTDERRSREEQL